MNKIVSRSLVCAAACAALSSAIAQPASAAVIVAGTCTDGGTVELCVTEVRTTGVRLQLYTATPGQPVTVGQVAGYLDTYRLDTLQFPCVTPVVNGSEVDACGALGLERVSRSVLVQPTDVGGNTSQITPHGAVYVCEATLKALVAGYGESGRTIFTACGEDLPQFSS
jgi:hypothetical protein